MSLRKVASVLVGLGLVIGLMGAGVGASFTDQATAAASITVGTLHITVTSTASGCVTTGNSVACTLPAINASAAGSAAFPFTVNNTGTIDAHITITSAIVAAPVGGTAFTDALAPVTGFALAHGASAPFAGGLSWAELVSGNEAQTITITYTIVATA